MLGIVAMKLDSESREIKPFDRSKFLNMLQKEIQQAKLELSVFMGDMTIDRLESSPELVKTPSYHVLKSVVEEKRENP